jgi:rubrerythrin
MVVGEAGNGRQPPRELRRRLAEAWRGEVEAQYVYEHLADRERDPRRADVLRRMADAESRHRARLEARMRELGIPVPDASSVRLPLWLRLQARVAPVERMLAAREAAEQVEIESRYRNPTGDDATDRLLADIRRDEKSHSLAVREMRTDARAGPEAPASRGRWSAGLEMTLAGIVVGAVPYGVGILFKVPA